MSQYFLGVDGGQSSTTAMIGDETGRVLGWATGGPCNHASGGEATSKFLRVIGDCLSLALTNAGLPRDQPFRAACLGMSGGPDDKDSLLSGMIATDRLIVTHDAAIALAGALNGRPGVIVIAGTGSIAFGRNEKGETARAGGWGHVFGDEGGAFDIVRQALRAALREHEGWGPRTALTPALLESAAASDANQLLHLWYTPEWPRARVASLAPLISRVAEEGDPVAEGILDSAAHNLSMLGTFVLRQLWREDEPRDVSWTGGVFTSRILLERFQALVELSGATPKKPQHGPAMGALLIAWRSVNPVVLPERELYFQD